MAETPDFSNATPEEMGNIASFRSKFQRRVMDNMAETDKRLRDVESQLAYTEDAPEPEGMYSVLSRPFVADDIPDSFPWSSCDFGYSYSGATFTLKAGEIQIGDQAAVSSIDVDLTISADDSYVGWEYDYTTGALTGKNFGTSITYESGKIKKWLYLVSYSSSVITGISRYGFMNQTIPASFGDT